MARCVRGFVLCFGGLAGGVVPVLRQPLKSFSHSRQKFADAGVSVLALSVEDEGTGKQLIADADLAIPVAHSVDAQAFAAATGALPNAYPLQLQCTGFILGPDGTVLAVGYSTGSVRGSCRTRSSARSPRAVPRLAPPAVHDPAVLMCASSSGPRKTSEPAFARSLASCVI